MDLVNTLFNRPLKSLLVAAGLTFGTQTASAEWPELVSARYFQPEVEETDTVSTASGDLVFRGQSDPFYTIPVGVSPIPAISGEQSFSGEPILMAQGDPFAGGQMAPPPASFDPFTPQGVYGINGPQPYRLGWKEQLDWAIAPNQGTSPDFGTFGWNELNYTKEYNRAGRRGGMWSFSPQINLRWLEGPSGPTAPAIESDMYRFGLGIKYATPQTPNGVSFEFGFNPSIASDLGQPLTGDAWQFDAHAASFWRTGPTWMWVLGVMYWDRKDDIILPYAGAVWTPNDYFEARILFPKTRLEWFMGTPYGVPTWLYATAEYHVEAFEVGFANASATQPDSTIMQIEDYRIMGGVRWETGWLETFMEGGIILDRNVDFGAGGPDFEVDESFMARVGFKF